MKKLILGAAVAMSSLSFAQQFGIKAGMNVSSLSKDASLSDQKSKIGFNAGVFMNAPLAANFSIQPELLYSQMGDKSTSTNTNTIGASTIVIKTTGSTNIDYVTVPVMFQYKATPDLYLEAGPEFGLMVSGKSKGDTTITSTTGSSVVTSSTSGSTDVKDHLNNFNFGIGLGAGYYFTPNIGLTARYTAGVTKVGKSDDNVNYYDDSRNNVFQVGLAYKF